jgi:hypothetical protein
MQISTLIDELLNETLLGTYRAHFNRLTNAVSATDDTLTVDFPMDGIGDGSYVELGQELLYVVPAGLNSTARTIKVMRGARGSVAVPHSAGAGLSINPRFARVTILSAFQEEVRSWPMSVFQIAQLDTNMGTGDTAIDLAGLSGFDDIIRVVKVWRRSQSPDDDRWIPLTGFRFEKDLFSMGSADLFLAKTYGTGQEIRILVARPFTDPASWTESSYLADSGIPDSMADIVKYGAAWRLVTGREIRRNFTEVESEGRNTQEVPAGANLTLGRNLKLMRDGRLAEEITRMRSFYGIRSR